MAIRLIFKDEKPADVLVQQVNQASCRGHERNHIELTTIERTGFTRRGHRSVEPFYLLR